ncbi:hypothetical protein [Herbidospora mongoliensis]|uniref:hypothetical protein n=1 Tax=Herbidospora mongoliensis TaxID=688067 RepID=UPI00082E6520|nr:hypothetical protein [Herbidospora mongoliensis]
MPFDEARYVREVLDPARATGVPPEDLVVRYALSRDPTQIGETVKAVRQCWRRQRSQLKFRRLVDRLEADHSRLAPIFDAAVGGDLGPLNQALAQAGKRDRARLDEARRRLDDAAGRLRMVTPDVVAGIARSTGLDLAPLARELGVSIQEPEVLATVSPYAAYDRLKEALETLQMRHLAAFVVGPEGPYRVLRPTSLPLNAVEADWRRKTRGPWTTAADTLLTALKSDPAALIRYDMVARLRERVREHPYDDTLLRHAIDDLGLEADEARRLVFAVRQETGAGGGPLARLRDLADAGEIHAAADLAASLDLDGPAAELAAEIRARLAAAEALREKAMAASDADEAWLALADALRRVPDLPGAADLQRRLVPLPAEEVRATVDGASVTVTWRPSGSKAGEISYEILRNGFPIDGGEPFRVTDAEPPIDEPLVYGVVARRGAAAPARVTAAPPVTVRPEVADVRIRAGDGLVTGRWTRPAHAAGVVVTRDGTPIEIDGAGFTDRLVRNGAGYVYLVKAVYSGGVTTAGVRARATPHARPVPVRDFTVEPAPDGQILLRCPPPPAGHVEFRLLETAPPWAFGTTISLAEARATGRALAGLPAPDGHLVKAASGVLLAVTVAGDLATIGGTREHVNLTPPRSLSTERLGPTVHVGLDWPPDVPEVEVVVNGVATLVSAASYRAQGGFRVDVAEDEPVTVEVVPTALVGGVRLRGPSLVRSLEAVTPVRYDISRSGPFWRRRLVVEVFAERPVALARLVLVLRPGRVEPLNPDQGTVLGEWADVLTPARFEVKVPRQAKPYWLKCFAGDGVELIGPPVRRLKVGS